MIDNQIIQKKDNNIYLIKDNEVLFEIGIQSEFFNLTQVIKEAFKKGIDQFTFKGFSDDINKSINKFFGESFKYKFKYSNLRTKELLELILNFKEDNNFEEGCRLLFSGIKDLRTNFSTLKIKKKQKSNKTKQKPKKNVLNLNVKQMNLIYEIDQIKIETNHTSDFYYSTKDIHCEADLVFFTDGSFVEKGKKQIAVIAGYGVKNNKVVVEFCENVEVTNSNQAEFLAIKRALEIAKQMESRSLKLFTDSQGNVSRIRSASSKENSTSSVVELINLSSDFENVSFCWVNREKNKRADLIARLKN